MHSIIRDEHGRFVPVVRPKRWQAASVNGAVTGPTASCAPGNRRKARLATTQWMNELDRRGIAELEATGIRGLPSNAGSTRWIRARPLRLGCS